MENICPRYDRLRELVEEGEMPVVVLVKNSADTMLTYSCSYKVKPDSPVIVGTDDQQKEAIVQIMRFTMGDALRSWKKQHGSG